MLDRMMGLVNMVKRAFLQPTGVRIVFLVGNVMMGFIQQLERFANPPAAGHMPVSYTHLDVYKRQPVGCKNARFTILTRPIIRSSILCIPGISQRLS